MQRQAASERRNRYHMSMTQASRSSRCCPWYLGSEATIRHHDEECGAPVHDERVLFEFLIPEGAQTGLSGSTILDKQENDHRAPRRAP